MRYVDQWSILALLCLFGTQQGQAQPPSCGGGQVCIIEAPAAAATKPEQSSAVIKLANLAGLEQCTGVAVDVTASSSEERLLACAAAGEALELLGRCKIYARKRVSVHILSELNASARRPDLWRLRPFPAKSSRYPVQQYSGTGRGYALRLTAARRLLQKPYRA